MVEFALILPWYVFLFIGTFDMGIYCYSLISVQGAARAACMYTALNKVPTDQVNACRYALAQMTGLPNYPGSSWACNSSPLTVTATQITGPDGANAAQVVVTYIPAAMPFIPSSGATPILGGQMTVTRTVVMKL